MLQRVLRRVLKDSCVFLVQQFHHYLKDSNSTLIWVRSIRIFLQRRNINPWMSVGKSGIRIRYFVCGNFSFIIFLEKIKISSRIIEFEIWIVMCYFSLIFVIFISKIEGQRKRRVFSNGFFRRENKYRNIYFDYVVFETCSKGEKLSPFIENALQRILI
jgi:hypothetical protein